MQLSRRALEIAGFSVVLVLCAVVFIQPLMLFGAAGVGAWLLGRQRAFAEAAGRMNESLTVRTSPSQPTTTVNRDVPVAVIVDLDEPTPLSLTFEPKAPLAARLTDQSTTTLVDDETHAELSYTIQFPVAGQHDLASIEITLHDDRGLFEETIRREPLRTVTVSPSGKSRLHVGRGGSDVSEGYGEQSRQAARRGLEPQEIREYVSGDLAKNIDWNATARLGELYVRQYGTENDQHVLVVLDQREAMNVGPPGETKFDYAREVTLGFLQNADSTFDSVALYSVDDEAITSAHRAQSATKAAGSLRDPLFQLSPAGDTSSVAGVSTAKGSSLSRSRVAGRLSDDTSTFERQLKPYFRSRVLIEGSHDDPTRTAIQRERAAVDDDLSVVIVTDDTAPRRVRETVQFAQRVADRVTLFLTPQVLFESGGLDDLDTAYQRYLEFEHFRRDLDRLANVTAFEVGPGDRLEAIVTSRRGR